MTTVRKRPKGNGEREEITVSLPGELADKLRAFCLEKSVSADVVVERALAEYFREGEMCH